MGVDTQSSDMPQWQRDAMLGGAGYGESTSSTPGHSPHQLQRVIPGDPWGSLGLQAGPGSLLPQGGQVAQPSNSKVVLNHRPDGLEIEIPSVGFTLATLAMIVFTIIWNFFVWSAEISVSRPRRRVISLLFMLPFFVAGFWLIWECLRLVLMRTRVFLGPTNYFIEWSMGSRIIQTRGGRTQHISAVKMLTSTHRHVFGSADEARYDLNDTTITETKSTCVEIAEGRKSYKFGESLKAVENDWLAREVSAFLGHPPPTNTPPQESTTFFEKRVGDGSGQQLPQSGYPYPGVGGQSSYGTAPIPSSWNQTQG